MKSNKPVDIEHEIAVIADRYAGNIRHMPVHIYRAGALQPLVKDLLALISDITIQSRISELAKLGIRGHVNKMPTIEDWQIYYTKSEFSNRMEELKSKLQAQLSPQASKEIE